MQATRIYTILMVSFIFSVPASAQVFDSGPSNPALFTTVLNRPGDSIPDFDSVGGVVGETTQLNVVHGGTLLFGFDALEGSEVNISGGSVANRFGARDGSEVNISGGSMGYFVPGGGSEVNISGGTLGAMHAQDESVVNITGGSFTSLSNVTGDVELVGGEFKLNGQVYTAPIIPVAGLGANDVFSGTLADGSAFIFSELTRDYLSRVTLTLASEPLPAASLIPIVVAAPVDSGPHGLRQGQSLTLQAGGELRDNFAVVEATLNVEGGVAGRHLNMFGSVADISGGIILTGFDAFDGSVVNISGGSVGSSFDAYEGSVINVSGGSIAFEFGAFDGSVVNISGGEVGGSFEAHNGSAVNISGGSVGDGFAAFGGSLVNISGGDVGEIFTAFEGSKVNLFGRAFALDGVLLGDLTEGEAFIVLERDVTLSGLLADGSPFSFDLNSVYNPYPDYPDMPQDTFEPLATLTVTLTPGPLLGDCNLDGFVNFLDIAPFISILSAGDFLAEADINEDGEVDFLDIGPFIGLLSSNN